MKKQYMYFMLLLAMATTTALAQVSKIPADTRLYLQTLQTGKKAPSIDGKVRQREAKLFVSCAPNADTKAIEAQMMMRHYKGFLE